LGKEEAVMMVGVRNALGRKNRNVSRRVRGELALIHKGPPIEGGDGGGIRD